jgi:hypothetical protein
VVHSDFVPAKTIGAREVLAGSDGIAWQGHPSAVRALNIAVFVLALL